MSSWQNEFKTQLVGVLAGESDLTDLLASDQAVFYRQPDQAAAFPCVVYDFDAAYDPSTNKPGKHVVRLRLTAWAGDPDLLDSIEEALRDLLDDSPSQLTSANWRCARCRLLSSERQAEPHFDPATQQPLAGLTSEWEVWLYAA